MVTPMEPEAALEDVIGDLANASTIAVGGLGSNRRPMALLRSLVDAGVRDLTVVSFLGGLDVEMLLAAGVMAHLHTAGTSLDAAGLAPGYRTARQTGAPIVHEWGEGSLHAALEAAARGLPYLPTRTAAGSDVVATNPRLAIAEDPFGSGAVVLACAIPIDLALLHVPAASPVGDLFHDGDPGVDDLLVRAARRVVVSTDTRVDRPASDASISRLWVDRIVDLPGGSWPTPCIETEPGDPSAAHRWVAADVRTPDLLWEGRSPWLNRLT